MTMNTEELLEYLKYNGAERAGAAAGLSWLTEEPSMQQGIVVLLRLPVRIAGYLRSGPYGQYVAACARMDHNMAEILQAGMEKLRKEGYRAEGLMAKLPEEGEYPGIREVDRFQIDRAGAAAGLGWIGRNGRLLVRDFGPCVRSAVILTDMPVTPSEPETESHCGACRVCVGNCPAEALTGKVWTPGTEERVLIDRPKCEEFIRSGVCEKCVGICTYAQKYMRNAKWY